MTDPTSGRVLTETALPDRLSLAHRVALSCGCIRAVDKVSGLAVIEKECGR